MRNHELLIWLVKVISTPNLSTFRLATSFPLDIDNHQPQLQLYLLPCVFMHPVYTTHITLSISDNPSP